MAVSPLLETAREAYLVGRRSLVASSPAITYGAIGVLNTVGDIALFAVLTGILGWSPVPANAVSFSLAAAQSYLLNAFVTFPAAGAPRNHARAAALFGAVTTASLSLSSVVIFVASVVLPPLAAKLVATVATFVFGYWAHKRLTFADLAVQTRNRREPLRLGQSRCHTTSFPDSEPR